MSETEKKEGGAKQVIQEQGKSLSLSLIAALFIGVCTYFFAMHFSGKVNSLKDSATEATALAGGTTRGDDESKWSYTNRLRTQLLEDEEKLQKLIVEKKKQDPVSTEPPDRYVSTYASQLSEAIQAAEEQAGLTREMMEQLQNLENENH